MKIAKKRILQMRGKRGNVGYTYRSRSCDAGQLHSRLMEERKHCHHCVQR